MAACICGWTTKLFAPCRYLSKNVAHYRLMLIWIWISNGLDKVSCGYRNIALRKAVRTHLISRKSKTFISQVEEIQISFLPFPAQTGVRPLFQLSSSFWLPCQLPVAPRDCEKKKKCRGEQHYPQSNLRFPAKPCWLPPQPDWWSQTPACPRDTASALGRKHGSRRQHSNMGSFSISAKPIPPTDNRCLCSRVVGLSLLRC